MCLFDIIIDKKSLSFLSKIIASRRIGNKDVFLIRKILVSSITDF